MYVPVLMSSMSVDWVRCPSHY